jgi:hypothetical protein
MKSWGWASWFLGCAVVIGACTVEQSEDDGESSPSSASTAATGGASATGTGGGSGACETQPTYTECAECFCDGDDVGCTAQKNIVGMYLYCGQSCSAACTAFCTSYDPADIDAACSACADPIDCQNPVTPENQADCMSASESCQADANCEAFREKLQMCPAG